MKTREDIVKEFNRAFSLPVDLNIGRAITSGNLSLCNNLIYEEFTELDDAVCALLDPDKEGDIENVLKELADLQYVISGFAVRMGLNLEEAFQRVHLSNMSKLGEDGKPIYNDLGKVMKGPNYKEPYLSDLVEEEDYTNE